MSGGKRVWRILLLTLSLAAVGCGARPPASRPAAQAKPDTYAHNASGLEKQFADWLEFRNSGDAAGFRNGFQAFILRDAQNWFSQYFAKDQVQQLVDDQEGEVEAFRNSTTALLDRLMLNANVEVHCSKPKFEVSNTKPRSDAILPIRPVSIEQFEVVLEGKMPGEDKVRSLSMLVNVVYVDGAFRFLGKGALPFWSMP